MLILKDAKNAGGKVWSGGEWVVGGLVNGTKWVGNGVLDTTSDLTEATGDTLGSGKYIYFKI